MFCFKLKYQSDCGKQGEILPSAWNQGCIQELAAGEVCRLLCQVLLGTFIASLVKIILC